MRVQGGFRADPAAWELAAVSTLPEYRLHGCSRQVLSFLTSAILYSGRLATCTTMETNQGMIATALSIGYQIVRRNRSGGLTPT